MYEQRSIKKMVEFKIRRKMLDDQLMKLKLILSIGALQDVFYIKALLKKIKLSKELFVLELEQG